MIYHDMQNYFIEAWTIIKMFLKRTVFFDLIFWDKQQKSIFKRHVNYLTVNTRISSKDHCPCIKTVIKCSNFRRTFDHIIYYSNESRYNNIRLTRNMANNICLNMQFINTINFLDDIQNWAYLTTPDN